MKRTNEEKLPAPKFVVPPLVDGNVAESDRIRARITAKLSYGKYWHPADFAQAIIFSVQSDKSSLTEAHVVSKLEELNTDVLLQTRPNLALMSPHLRTRFSLLLPDLKERHIDDLVQMVNAFIASGKIAQQSFEAQMQRVLVSNSAERKSVREQVLQ